MNLEEKTRAALQSTFNPPVPARIFSAPGRVNLIGEHTDYNDGFVLPAAIDFKTVVAAAPRTDSIIEVFAVDMDDIDTFDLAEPIVPSNGHMWANYVRGMAKVLLAHGHSLTGASLAIMGNIPTGAGLSSSASLEMALGHAFLSLSGIAVDGMSLAKIGQEAENNFVGVQCGIMDQFISALGKKNHAMLLDCRDLSYDSVPMPTDTAIIIVDSGVKRGLVDSEYNARREQCTAAANFLGAASLRDVTPEMFAAAGTDDMPPLLAKRARHVITENKRTRRTAAALKDGDMDTVGALLNESHISMRDDFEITVPAIDALVEILQAVPGVYGARMTGGGFGGCCVALAPKTTTQAIIEAVETQYPQICCYHATVYRCQASDGASEKVLETIS